MTKKEKLELAAIVANAVVEAMKASTVNPTSANTSRSTKSANEGKKTKTSHKPYSGNVPEVSEQKLLLEAKGRGSATKYSMKIADYEPKMKDGNYIWGKKTDTIKSKHYMAMQKAYCYAVATKGKAITSDECFKMGIEVDFAEGKAYSKAKAEFKNKYKYVKKADR